MLTRVLLVVYMMNVGHCFDCVRCVRVRWVCFAGLFRVCRVRVYFVNQHVSVNVFAGGGRVLSGLTHEQRAIQN